MFIAAVLLGAAVVVGAVVVIQGSNKCGSKLFLPPYRPYTLLHMYTTVATLRGHYQYLYAYNCTTSIFVGNCKHSGALIRVKAAKEPWYRRITDHVNESSTLEDRYVYNFTWKVEIHIHRTMYYAY